MSRAARLLIPPFCLGVALCVAARELGGQPADASSRSVTAVQVPDDSPASRAAAIERLRTAPPREICTDASYGSRSYGTSCGTREFPAPAILEPPKMAWSVRPGWWGVWSPFLIGNLVLTGSCNNEDNKGLSALDITTGRTVWRIPSICDEGQRTGTTGQVRFYGLSAREVLFIYRREDGKPDDFYVVDLQAGRIVRTLTPTKRGPTSALPGVFIVLTQSTADRTSYLNALSPDLGQVVWRNSGYHLACDKMDPHCRPVFSGAAAHAGVLYLSITTRDQPDPPTRQVHAFDLLTGTLLWKHSDQPVVERELTNRGPVAYRSDDGEPMVADGKVLIDVQGSLGPGGRREPPTSYAIRALDARTGATRWTTTPVPRRLPSSATGVAALPTQQLRNRLVAGRALVVELAGTEKTEWLGYRLDDGALQWRRAAARGVALTASSGGAFYTAERVDAGTPDERYQLQAFEGETGTLLWTTTTPAHNVPFLHAWGVEDRASVLYQGPSWRIGADGAIYGVTLQGAYKLH